MSTCTDPRVTFDTLCHSIAEATFRKYGRNLTPLYLFGYKERGVYTELRIAHDKPRWHEMVVLVMLPRHLEVYQLTAWLRDWLKNAPLYTDGQLAELRD
jgi:hypothetical protein